jgi:hypothetical protein
MHGCASSGTMQALGVSIQEEAVQRRLCRDVLALPCMPCEERDRRTADACLCQVRSSTGAAGTCDQLAWTGSVGVKLMALIDDF